MHLGYGYGVKNEMEDMILDFVTSYDFMKQYMFQKEG